MNKLTFTTEIKESKYLHVYENENIYALYHAYYMNVVYLNKSSFATFNNLKKHKTLEDFCHVNPDLNKNKILSLFESLFQNGIITTYNNRERIDSAYIKNHSNIDIQIMYLIVTDSCNLKCKYCYIENSIPEDAKKVFMTEDLVSKSIDLFSKISKKNRRIIFYGGEPFLNKKTLKKGISYAREILKNDVELSIITNASDITKEDASFLEKHNVQISISIDGNKDITDSVRPFISGKGTYSSIQKSVKNLRDAGISNISASVTI
ncbi:MAG: hypothetical protein C0596_06480 [Marinilabiliales bacterium]|nr:MAG: hypothetical protein C0596_06480 [Marinilabiliales bacterium]